MFELHFVLAGGTKIATLDTPLNSMEMESSLINSGLQEKFS